MPEGMGGPSKWPEDIVSKELSEDISWINGSTDMNKSDYIRANCLTKMVVGQCIVRLLFSPMSWLTKIKEESNIA
jgi:hypothetical protein